MKDPKQWWCTNINHNVSCHSRVQLSWRITWGVADNSRVLRVLAVMAPHCIRRAIPERSLLPGALHIVQENQAFANSKSPDCPPSLCGIVKSELSADNVCITQIPHIIAHGSPVRDVDFYAALVRSWSAYQSNRARCDFSAIARSCDTKHKSRMLVDCRSTELSEISMQRVIFQPSECFCLHQLIQSCKMIQITPNLGSEHLGLLVVSTFVH